ncbi:MAG: hypothetical protein HOP19_00925 [Acidobacteria bacterium]|nr:hypothetical protein [Acidobacteriota bacterium]
MKKIGFGIVILVVLVFYACRPHPGERVEVYDTANHSFRIRVSRYAERNGGLVPGAYYVFQSAPLNSEKWRDIMTFRHDDPNPIPRDQIRFVNDNVGYVFMGWMYAVTTDGGASWAVWDAQQDLPKWQCCNYRLIGDVKLAADGLGTMTLNPIPERSGEVPQLYTRDYSRHWYAER